MGGGRLDELTERMEAALKARFVPALRERGFKGSYPHFHRIVGASVHLLSIFLRSRDKKLEISIGRGALDADGRSCEGVPLSKIDVRYVREIRRLGSIDVRRFSLDQAFDYGGELRDQSHYDGLADEALQAFEKVGDAWFDRPKKPESEPSGEPPWPFRRRLGWIARVLPWHRPRVRVASVIGSDARPLRDWQNWQQVVPAITRLVDLLPQRATIRPWLYGGGKSGRPIPFGTLYWNLENNRRWSESLQDPAIFMRKTEIWSPSRSSSIEKQIYPNLFAQLDGGQTVDRQGFVLAIRLDLLPSLAAAANEVVAQVRDVMPESRTLIADRAWEERRILGWVRVNNLDDAITLDAFEWADANKHAQVEAF